MADGGKIVGVFADERLVAFRALLVPGADEEHLGSDVGLDLTELGSVIYQEISTVSPRYRGYRLKKMMADYRYVCGTVAPFNIACLKDKFSR